MEQKLIPFDFDKAFRLNNPVITRDGREILDIVYMPNAHESQKIACTVMAKQGPTLYGYHITGSFIKGHIDCADLFMKPVEKEYWVVSFIHAVTNKLVIFNMFDLERDAQRYVEETYLTHTCNPQIHKITRTE